MHCLATRVAACAYCASSLSCSPTTDWDMRRARSSPARATRRIDPRDFIMRAVNPIFVRYTPRYARRHRIHTCTLIVRHLRADSSCPVGRAAYAQRAHTPAQASSRLSSRRPASADIALTILPPRPPEPATATGALTGVLFSGFTVGRQCAAVNPVRVVPNTNYFNSKPRGGDYKNYTLRSGTGTR